MGFLLLLPACSSTKTIQSQYATTVPAIDANVNDWDGGVKQVEKERFSLGVSNDTDYLYLAFMSRDESVTRQIMTRGLMIWLDAEGGKDKSLGVKYPVGLMASDARGGMGRGAGNFDAGGSEEARQQQAQRIQAASEKMLAQLEVIGDETAAERIGSEDTISASGSYDYGILTFELRLPLASLNGLPVDEASSAVVGVGLEVPEIDREAVREQTGQRGGGRAGGGRRGGGGRAGGIGGGRPGGAGGAAQGRGGGAQETLNHWFKAELSQNEGQE
ncbi:MAG: hypothetical protein AAF564_24915 [Bacteroidota bacterium]